MHRFDTKTHHSSLAGHQFLSMWWITNLRIEDLYLFVGRHCAKRVSRVEHSTCS